MFENYYIGLVEAGKIFGFEVVYTDNGHNLLIQYLKTKLVALHNFYRLISLLLNIFPYAENGSKWKYWKQVRLSSGVTERYTSILELGIFVYIF